MGFQIALVVVLLLGVSMVSIAQEDVPYLTMENLDKVLSSEDSVDDVVDCIVSYHAECEPGLERVFHVAPEILAMKGKCPSCTADEEEVLTRFLGSMKIEFPNSYQAMVDGIRARSGNQGQDTVGSMADTMGQVPMGQMGETMGQAPMGSMLGNWGQKEDTMGQDTFGSMGQDNFGSMNGQDTMESSYGSDPRVSSPLFLNQGGMMPPNQ